MNRATKLRRIVKGTRELIPMEKEGYCKVDILDNALVVDLAPEDKRGVVIPESALKELGYIYKKERD